MVWVFGISEGALIKLSYFFDRGYGHSRRLVMALQFDGEWERPCGQRYVVGEQWAAPHAPVPSHGWR
jgi:hypothetical protein